MVGDTNYIHYVNIDMVDDLCSKKKKKKDMVDDTMIWFELW